MERRRLEHVELVAVQLRFHWSYYSVIDGSENFYCFELDQSRHVDVANGSFELNS